MMLSILPIPRNDDGHDPLLDKKMLSRSYRVRGTRLSLLTPRSRWEEVEEGGGVLNK